MGVLNAFRNEGCALKQNSLLFDLLRDDRNRAQLYDELRTSCFPVLRFKSVLRSSNNKGWPNQDVYLLSSEHHIRTALEYGSVEPYASLESGGKFMLGLDDFRAHDDQNAKALRALRYCSDEIKACAQEAFKRAAVLPLKKSPFDLPNQLAEQAALRFVELLFGFDDTAYPYLEKGMQAAYTRLVFQIIGRHFVSDSGLPPADSDKAKELKQKLASEVREAACNAKHRPGAPKETVIERLVREYGTVDNTDLVLVALGLIAGTIGNISAAVSIAVSRFFAEGKIDEARRAARCDNAELSELIQCALVNNPPAPFLARRATGREVGLNFKDEHGDARPVPKDAYLLLAMGADADYDLVFGGADPTSYPHRCIGKHLAEPLITEVVRGVLLIPGLSQVIDRDTGRPVELKKRWGAICESYSLQFQRDRLLNQQPLHLVLPIKEPVAENAKKLLELTRIGAPIIQDALDRSKHVHSAYFMLVNGGTHLAMMTVYDGDIDAYVEHFATGVSLFDEQLQYLKDAPPTPTRSFPKQFVQWIKDHNYAPLGDFFYSAYPGLTVSDVVNATEALK